MSRNIRFVLYVIAALAIANGGTTLIVLLSGMEVSSAYGLGNIIAAILIAVMAPKARMSSWWALLAFIPVIVWYPLIRGSWRLAGIHSGEAVY